MTFLSNSECRNMGIGTRDLQSWNTQTYEFYTMNKNRFHSTTENLSISLWPKNYEFKQQKTKFKRIYLNF